MPRPCACDNVKLCKFCRMYHQDEAYRARCDGTAPTLAQRAASFLLAIKFETEWRLGGGAAPKAEEKAIRRALCNACEFLDSEHDACLQCGCYLEAKMLHIPPIPLGKLDCSTQQCPLEKWNTCGGYVAKMGCGKPCGSN